MFQAFGGKKKMKVLLIRMSSMGDLVHTLPAITDLARHRPDLSLHWLCESSFADIARLHPFVHKVHELSWRKWRKQLWKKENREHLKNLAQLLENEHFDLVVDSQSLLKSAFFAKMAKAPIYGLNKDCAREPLAAWFYDRHFQVDKHENVVLRTRQLFARIFDYDVQGQADFGVNVPLSGSIDKLPEHYYVACHATSRDSKLWSEKNWIDLFTRTHQKDGFPVLLPWGNDVEYARAQRIASALPNAQVCPKLNLLQAAYLMYHARAVIGVDTGFLHLANAVNPVVIGLYTDTNPARTGIQETNTSINLGGIGQNPSVDEVYATLMRFLEI